MTATSGGRVALVTCPDFPELSTDEALIAPHLEARGWEVARLSWDQTDTPWTDLAGVVLRSTWDYTERLEPFLRWVDALDSAGAPLWNPPEIIRWNHDKRYLEDLEERGVAVVPTGWIERGGLVHLHEIMAFEGWDEAVVKPVVSAGARDTYAVTAAEARGRDREFRLAVSGRPMMVQQFMPEVRKHGEVSLCFFGGAFSHAVRKRPAAGDFRVQERFGGTVEAFEPAAALVEQAEEILGHVEGEWLYARVDAVVRKKKLVLMELELLEPSMYCEYAPGAAARFAAAIDRRIAGR